MCGILNIDKLDSLKSIYSDLNNSAIICDNDYNIIWINNFTKKYLSEILNKKNLKKAFPIYNYEKITEKILEKKTCETKEISFNFSNISLEFIPIIDNFEIQGTIVFIKSSDPFFSMPFSLDIDRIISAVSGQFRSPLFSIFNLLAPLSRRLEEYELYDDIEYINHIARNCYKMIKSTVNLSEYFKISDSSNEKNGNNLNFKRLNINKYLEDLCKSIQIILTSSNINLEYTMTREIIITNIDPERFSIAFLNIISNSCVYTSPGNTIHVSLERIRTDAVITISDNGVGISKERLNKVFEPYYSYNPNFISESMHTGLGLTIVKKIIEAHNGSYFLNSVENKGTSIAIKFPINDDIDVMPYLESNTANYIANKFSPLYIFLADLCDFNTF